MPELKNEPTLHIVVELPTGDWAKLPDGASLVVYTLEDAEMAAVETGAISLRDANYVNKATMELDFDDADTLAAN